MFSLRAAMATSRKRGRQDSPFEEMLQSSRVLRSEPTTEHYDDFNLKLSDCMKTKMSKDLRERLDVICHHSNFFAFHKDGLFKLLDDLQVHFKAGKCRRSNPPVFLTQLLKFKEDNSEVFKHMSQSGELHGCLH